MGKKFFGGDSVENGVFRGKGVVYGVWGGTNRVKLGAMGRRWEYLGGTGGGRWVCRWLFGVRGFEWWELDYVGFLCSMMCTVDG